MFMQNPYIYLKRKELHVMLKACMLSFMYGVKTIDKLDINKYKTSDTLFILGSGRSVNDLSNSNWDVISSKDSIGLNFWIIHDFVPTFYCYEEPGELGDRKNIFYDILNKKKELFLNRPFIIKDLLSSNVSFGRIPEEIKSNVYLSLDFDIPVNGNDGVMMEYLMMIKMSNRLRFTGRLSYIYSITASISYLCFFSLLMGYKKVVFCGVDLVNSLYFYEENEHYYNGKGLCVPKSMQSSGVHSTDFRTQRKIPISHVINTIYNCIIREAGIKFYVAQNYGSLSKYFQAYF